MPADRDVGLRPPAPETPLIPLDRIGRYLTDALGDDRWLTVTTNLIAGGKSNLTYELSCPAGELILRRPPSGDLLPRAHDMGREVTVQRALKSTAVPVPRIVAYDLDGGLFGTPFYVMEKVEGHVIRAALPPGYAASEAGKRAVTDALVQTLVELHRLQPAAVGLETYGRPDGFLHRQIRRWQSQWDASRTVSVPAVDELSRRLSSWVPKSGPAAVVHGDFRLDNCLMDLHSPARVAAVLDWELSTVGDPLTDLGLLLFYWRQAGEIESRLTPTATTTPGFPDRKYVAESYAAAAGVSLEHLAWYHAFAHFKFAVIAQGVLVRVDSGSMGGQSFGDLNGEVEHFAELGITTLEGDR